MNDNADLLRNFFDILNEHTSGVTGWPNHRIVRSRCGKTRKWRSSEDRHYKYIHSKFIAAGLMRVHLEEWEFKDDGLVSYEEYYRDFVKGDGNRFVYAVQREFLIKTLTLGFIPE